MSQTTQTNRKVNRTKRAKLNSHGFKVYKNFKLYIGKATEGGWSRGPKPAPRKELVDAIREMWNNDPSIKAIRKHIKELSITYQKTNKLVGFWENDKQKVAIIDDHVESISQFKSTFIHEVIGHAFWDFARKWRREELIKFNVLVESMPPLTTYIEKNEGSWRNTIDENEDETAFEKSISHIPEYDASQKLCEEYENKYQKFLETRQTNGYSTMTRYANETHSAVSEIVYGIGGHEILLEDSDVQRLVNAWKELHY